jgi:hypothetical protein
VQPQEAGLRVIDDVRESDAYAAIT